MHLVLQVPRLQANLTITRQTDATLTVVRTITTIQEMTILETVSVQSVLMIAHPSMAETLVTGITLGVGICISFYRYYTSRQI